MATHEAAVFGHINCIGSASGAFRGGIGGIGQGVGRDDAGECPA